MFEFNFLSVFQGLLTPLIALIAVYITYQQYSINRKKMKLDLFEKRMKIFNVTKQLLYRIIQEDQIDILLLKEYRNNVYDSIFLFRKEVSDFIAEINKRAIALNHSSDGLADFSVGSNELNERVRQRTEMRQWFSNEYETLEQRFLKYLDFRRI